MSDPAASPQPSDQVTLGDKTVETSNFDTYKGVKGRTDRISILSKTLTRGLKHYSASKKKSFAPSDDANVNKQIIAAIGDPDQRFAMLVFHYTTDEAGNLLSEEKLSGKVKVWVVSETRYEELSALHKKFPLLNNGFADPQNDIEIKCTDEQYQRMTMTPVPSSYWKSKEDWFKAIMSKADKITPAKLKDKIARKLPDVEVLDIIGAAVPNQTGTTANAGDIDLDDVV